uniref:Ig-like domain-containing protein n=1 Tax=Denticeps clupeoides TaxID=299321 RepID=A0AAY3ZY98_9TELE
MNGPTPFICSFCVSGVFTEQCWGVTHAAMRVCALKGSSIDLSCTYTFPPNHTLNSSLWYIQWDKSANVKDLRLHEEYLGRVDYLGTKVRESIMRITDVKDSDTNEYRFSILTHEGGSFHSKPGVILNVTELEVKVSPDSVREGQRVTLTCSATCTLSNNPTYIWYKNRQPVSDKHTTRDNRLYLNSCSREDEGSYSCAVRGHEGPAHTLHVIYTPVLVLSDYPKRTLVLISHFMKSVTLTCTSDVSPPVHTYTWYKLNGAETSQVGSGQNYSLTNISSESNAQYFCEAKNDVGARNSTLIISFLIFFIERGHLVSLEEPMVCGRQCPMHNSNLHLNIIADSYTGLSPRLKTPLFYFG